MVEDSRPTTAEDVEAADDAGPSLRSTGEKKEKVSRPFLSNLPLAERLISRKQQ